jgi:plasmid stabilization system protein ParE
MGKRIIWQPKPQRQVREIECYFRDELGTIQAFDNFLDALYKRLATIADYPESGRPTGYKAVRYWKVDKHRSVFYRIKPDRIVVLLIWDSRQHPDKNPYKKKKK